MFEKQRKIEKEDEDLGFGSVVAQRSQDRLLNRDGSFNVERRGMGLISWINPYHSMLTMSWPRFVLLALVGYLLTNAMFATGYLLCGPGALGGTVGVTLGERWLESLFFSVQTLSTVGYGHVYPATTAANVVMTVESVCSLFALALGTGLIFARFSRPIARVIFSDKAVVAPYRGGTAFMFRVANRKRSQMVSLEARVVMSRLEQTDSGPKRGFYGLELERHKVSFLPLTWTLVHPIDEDSPLHNVTEAEFLASDAEVLILLTGMDETFSQMVHSRSSYKAHEVVWSARFQSLYDSDRPIGNLSIDISRLHDIESVES
jgi:inward rectifier potassium channel